MMVAALVLLVSCGSKKYKEASSIIKETTQKLNKAKSCQELDAIYLDDFYERYYEGGLNSRAIKKEISESEYEKLDQQEWDCEELLHKRMKELRCECKDDDKVEDEDEWLDDLELELEPEVEMVDPDDEDW